MGRMDYGSQKDVGYIEIIGGKMKKIEIIVKDCLNCPNMIISSNVVSPYRCKKVPSMDKENNELHYAKIHSVKMIPDWCPLEELNDINGGKKNVRSNPGINRIVDRKQVIPE